MRLQKPFCRLPVRFDAERLRYEIEAIPLSAWSKHPSGYAGNSALRLITAHGGDNDDVVGEMKATENLARCPYIQQVFASFGVVWSRARLMKLGPRSQVPPHCDINYHWFHRVRIHIPVVTFPEVAFSSGGQTVHMAAGEAWIFDNWRSHHVDNPTDHDRIHLVADTMGNEQFWQMAQRGQWEDFARPADSELVPYRAIAPPELLMERFNSSVVMPPAELEALVGMLASELSIRQDTAEARTAIVLFRQFLHGFCSEWRQVWSLFGETMPGWPYYANLRQQLRDKLKLIQVPVYLRSNQISATKALQAGMLAHVLNPPGTDETKEVEYADQPQDGASGPAKPKAPARTVDLKLERPIFIVAAPRTGSTLLFETLAQSRELWTLGGEAHSLIEQFAELRPGSAGVDSNRLTGAQLTPEIAQVIEQRIANRLRNAEGKPPASGTAVRFLEKTPKNALRIPFFKALYPDALFLLLWRDPRENLSSIMEAWRSGGFVTYPSLDSSGLPWSLLLPPGWQEQVERPLEERAAFQWRTTNEIMLDDLAALAPQDWTAVNYSDFVAHPEEQTRRLCEFAGVAFDEALAARVRGPLPVSRHTLTAPKEDKWRKNEAEILRVLPSLEKTWTRLRQLGTASSRAA